MFDQDTICAVSTPPGEGGIGIIRISGKSAVAAASKVFRPRGRGNIADALSHTLRYGHVVDPATGERIDEALVSVMRAPTTYTREDVVEINCHGGMAPLSRTLDLLITAGARLAEPGEFTKRAFLNGRIDLAQAEAVMDVIRARTDLACRAANAQLEGGLSVEISALRNKLISILASVEAGIDFPEDDIEAGLEKTLANDVARLLGGVEGLIASASYGRIMREGFATAIVGRPNVGKSSLLNALLKQNRAIVTEVPGTTRDVLEEYLNVDGIPLRVLDTAGIRHSHDVVEQEGVRRSLAAIDSADIVLVVVDGSQELTPEDQRVLNGITEKNAIAVINKSDLPQKFGAISRPDVRVEVSCRTGAGLAELKRLISTFVRSGMTGPREHAWAVNGRHKSALEQAGESLRKALDTISVGLSPEFLAIDLRAALDSLGIIVGATYTEDILERIFNDFCIGK